MSDGECFQILKRNFRALSWLRERYYNNGLYGKNGTMTFRVIFFFLQQLFYRTFIKIIF